MRTLVSILICGLCFGATGCLPRVNVVQNPGPRDKGVRYYRPKPYLLVTPAGKAYTDPESKKNVVEPSDTYVQIQLQYLPDFSEEYSINVRTGFGTADVGIKLENGWNLTEINQKLDSQTDENLKAVAELIKAVPPAAFGANVEAVPPATVSARNVPLGYYESVIGRDNCGKKQIFGWRYLGFMPYAQCPITPSGGDCSICGEGGDMAIYGLVFENNVMVFKSLGEISNIPGSHAAATRVASR